MTELKKCPMTTNEAISRIEDHIRVHRIGEYPHILLYEALNMATAALRRAQPDNEPLTLEELRGMDGEPVRIIDPRGKRPSEWVVAEIAISGNGLYGRNYEIAFNFVLYGQTWLAYRREPEPEGGEG